MIYRILLILITFSGVWLEALNSQARAVVIDKNKKIVLVGIADNTDNRTTDFALARYNPDGRRDTTFNPDGLLPGQLSFDLTGTNEGITAAAIDGQNRIVIGGFTSRGINNVFIIGRLNQDGSVDTSFNAQFTQGLIPGFSQIKIGPLSDALSGLAIDSQGRIVVVGTTDNGTTTDFSVARLLPDGSLDQDFNNQSLTPGIFTLNLRNTNDTATAVALDSNDNIIVGGYSDSGLTTDFAIIKLTNEGVLDETFNEMSLTPGIIIEDLRETTDQAYALALDAQERILIGGFSSDGVNDNFALARYLADGSLDTSFNANGSLLGRPGIAITSISTTDDQIRGIALDSKQRIVVTGFQNNGTNFTFATARLTDSGNLDTTFNPGGVIPGVVITDVEPTVTGQTFRSVDNQAFSVAIQENDLIVVTGVANDGTQRNFTTLNYLENGDLNPNFNSIADLSFIQGIVFTQFGITNLFRAYGTPLIINTNSSFVDPDILEALRNPLLPVAPSFANSEPLLTNETQPVLSGFSGPNSIISLYINDILIAKTIADFNGVWTALLPPLFDGTYQATVLSTDPFSGVSLASLPLQITIDTHVPDAPVIKTPERNAVSDAEKVLISGQAEPDSLVILFLQGQEVARVQSLRNGYWSYESDFLKDGIYSVVAQGITKAGNASSFSDPVMFTVDTGAEEAPRVLAPQNGYASKRKTILFNGQARPNSPIRIFLNNVQKAVVKTDKRGIWSFKFSQLQDGSYTAYATSFNKKLKSQVITFMVDTVPPAAPLLKKINAEGLIAGTGEPGARVDLYLDGNFLDSATIDTRGGWTYAPSKNLSLAPGRHKVTMSVSDKAGNMRVIEKDIIL